MNGENTRELSTSAWLSDMARTAPGAIIGLFSFAVAVNLLLLVSPLYMLQVYDRILSSGSRDSLVWISVIAIFLLAVYAAAEAGRRRVSALAARHVDAIFAPRMFTRFERGGDPEAALPRDMSNLSRIEALLQNGGLIAFIDLFFTPLFLALLFLLDPLLGMIGLLGAGIVFIVALVAERSTQQVGREAGEAGSAAQSFILGIARQRSAAVSMGLMPALYARWRTNRNEALDLSTQAARSDGTFAALARAVRQMLQIAILGVGAALALSQQISPGAIVAGSIIMSRALAPIDQIVGAWRMIVQSRASWSELSARLGSQFDAAPFTPLPRPDANLKLDRVAIGFAGSETPLIRPFSYEVEGGRAIAIVGANGAGKTTLLQTLAGALPSHGGTLSLGGRDIQEWASADRGAFVGYVPQEVELSPGTVAENIARFRQGCGDDIFAAAVAAGAHEMILALPGGYDTLVGTGGLPLSAGQRQLIGLSRAVFGDPVLLLLDEPTANLDQRAREAVISAITARLEAGAIVFMSTHDRELIAHTHTVLAIRKGAMMAAPSSEYGPAKAQASQLATGLAGVRK